MKKIRKLRKIIHFEGAALQVNCRVVFNRFHIFNEVEFTREVSIPISLPTRGSFATQKNLKGIHRLLTPAVNTKVVCVEKGGVTYGQNPVASRCENCKTKNMV